MRVLRKLATRALLLLVALVVKRRATKMAQDIPTVAGVDLVRVAADGGPDDMVLLNWDGTIEMDSTPDDIATYQIPGKWPRYVCRVRSVTRLLARTDPENVAVQINAQLARQFAMDSLQGPHATAAPVPPGNVPMRIGETAVTIRNV